MHSTPLISASPQTTDISKFVRVNETSQHHYEVAGFGGSADIFSGKYTNQDGRVIHVAIKCIRPKNGDESDKEETEKLQRKLARELGIWHTVNGGDNIIKLLGIIFGIGPFPSPVCELCPWNLQDYLERKTPPPRHIKMMTDTLSGLSYMHGLISGPIAHGDVKLSNILVTTDETAMLCDFGRSRQSHDQRTELSNSSPFAGTVRYMSPELFTPNPAGPTPAADMWAYGCVALEVLCRIPPYHEATGEYQIIERIQSGHPPSERPRGLRASLINDALWSALSSCWMAQDWRPTSRAFLNRLTEMLQNGEVPTSPILPDLFPAFSGGPLTPWPSDLMDFSGLLESEWGADTLSSTLRASVWIAILKSDENEGNPATFNSLVAVKVPRLNASPESRDRHDHLQNLLRKMIQNRYGVRHQNIIDILGIDSSFSPHPGLVLEYCSRGNLIAFCKENPINRNEYTRPPSPQANAYSLMSDILEGLRYMHSYPVPIPQGDLTPENILVNGDGVAKISLFTFARVLTALPPSVALTASIGTLLPFRWMSPELVIHNQQPTTESDMWALGCICYWILTGLKPYATHRRDDFAGIESVRGHPPGTLANVFYTSSWITNGIWSTVGRCWKYDPLLRPSAKEFLKMLKELEGRSIKWLPVTVVDLVGKVRGIGTGGSPSAMILQCETLWRRYSYAEQKLQDNSLVSMALYETTYVPKWYSRAVPVVVKIATNRSLDKQALVASIRHETTLVSQLDHPHICKLLGIDSSQADGPTMIFEFCSRITLDMFLDGARSFSELIGILKDVASAVVYIHEHVNGAIVHGNIQPTNVFVLPDGRAKLANFTCAFQYVVGRPVGASSLSAVVSTPQLPSLYCDPEYYKEQGESGIPLPTIAGDVWSFGAVALSMFLESFRRKRPEDHVAQLLEEITPGHTEYPSLDGRILALVRPMLSLDPVRRPSVREVLGEISALL